MPCQGEPKRVSTPSPRNVKSRAVSEMFSTPALSFIKIKTRIVSQLDAAAEALAFQQEQARLTGGKIEMATTTVLDPMQTRPLAHLVTILTECAVKSVLLADPAFDLTDLPKPPVAHDLFRGADCVPAGNSTDPQLEIPQMPWPARVYLPEHGRLCSDHYVNCATHISDAPTTVIFNNNASRCSSERGEQN